MKAPHGCLWQGQTTLIIAALYSITQAIFFITLLIFTDTFYVFITYKLCFGIHIHCVMTKSN